MFHSGSFACSQIQGEGSSRLSFSQAQIGLCFCSEGRPSLNCRIMVFERGCLPSPRRSLFHSGNLKAREKNMLLTFCLPLESLVAIAYAFPRLAYQLLALSIAN